jgi:hypothetical protein
LRADPGMARPPSPKLPQLTLPFALAATLVAALLGFGASGCTPAIGDRCTISTDCSVQGNRICDTFEPNGYCTVVCSANSCPDNAACIEFAVGIPGCGYSDYAAPSRLGRSMCMKTCNTDSDCRADEGYTCVLTDTLGTTVAVLDSDQHPRICMIGPSMAEDGGSSSLPVCSPDRPDAPPLDLQGSESDGGDEGDAEANDAAAGGDAAGADAGDAGVTEGGDGGGRDGASAGDAAGGDAALAEGGDATAVGDGGDAALVEGGDAATDGGGDATIDDGGDDGSDATMGQAMDAGAADAPDEQ